METEADFPEREQASHETCDMTHRECSLHVGTYVLPAGMSPEEVINLFEEPVLEASLSGEQAQAASKVLELKDYTRQDAYEAAEPQAGPSSAAWRYRCGGGLTGSTCLLREWGHRVCVDSLGEWALRGEEADESGNVRAASCPTLLRRCASARWTTPMTTSAMRTTRLLRCTQCIPSGAPSVPFRTRTASRSPPRARRVPGQWRD